MSDIRIIDCCICGGDGKFIENMPDGTEREHPCGCKDGTVTVTFENITLDDIPVMCGEG